MKFDTIDKKPNIWNVAALSAAAALVVTVLVLTSGRKHIMAISIILDVYIACAIAMLISAFFKQLRYNPYSYNVIYYFGFSLFAFCVLSFSAVLTVRILKDPGFFSIEKILTLLSGASRNFLMLSAFFIIPFSITLAVSNVVLIKKEGLRPINILGIFLGFFLIGGLVFIRLYDDSFFIGPEVLGRRELTMSLVTSFYLYFVCMMMGAIAAGHIAAFHEPDPDKDILIILGYTLKDGKMSETVLKARADRAIEFRKKQLRETGKALLFITSGGKGSGEEISESRWMKNYLLSQGISEDIIVEEDQSTTTHENMIYSKEKIREIDPSAKVAFSTSNYHVFRSGLYARREKIRAVGMGAGTEWYFWPNASVRELGGILIEHRLKQVLILLGIIAFNIILIQLAYMAGLAGI